MAYNYNPYGNYYPQYQTYQQPVQQRPQANFDTPIQDLRFVTSEEAKAHIVYPNSNALLIDKNNGLAYLKSADGLGQSTMRTFKYEEVNGGLNPVSSGLNAEEYLKKEDAGEFLKQNDLEELKKQLATMEQKIEKLGRLSNLLGGEDGK